MRPTSNGPLQSRGSLPANRSASNISGTGDASDPDNRTLRLSARLSGGVAAPPSPAEEQEVEAGAAILSAQSIWLRFKIEPTDAAPAVSLAFADPGAVLRGDHASSRPGADSLVLIAPKSPAGNEEWLQPYDDPVSADIVFPRVGFNDFDRWLNNPLLLQSAIGKMSATDFETFRRWLMAAYIGRTFDERLSPLTDSLPDLAVDKLLIELTPLDVLGKRPGDATGASAVVKELPLAKLGDRPLPQGPGYKTLAADLDKLARHHSASLTITSTGDQILIDVKSGLGGQEHAITINVPRGMVARLTVRPMVAKTLVGSVLDERLAGLATELRGTHYVFDGAALNVESMLGALAARNPQPWQDKIDRDNEGRSVDWEGLVSRAVAVRPAGRLRSYDLVANPAMTQAAETGWRWRQLGSIDIQTQRWRFTGRPIYSWFDPKKGCAGPGGSFAVAPPTTAELVQFEAESFFDRDDQDADIQTMRLDPAPAETILQSFPWEPPSATYFRHRLTARSRYAGALRATPEQAVAVRAWGKDSEPGAKAWIRVAMLADRTRLQLTRPQLRALIPLTVAPAAFGDDAAALAPPPIMAVLDERPYAHGGLADRIGAEIKTSLGYALPASAEGGSLGVVDTRKEFGPDPRLSYSATPADEALALTLRAEGPIGLTFDSDAARAPVFANTALVLGPALLNGVAAVPASLEEHFLSVALCRYLDHRWLADAPQSRDLRFDSSWWIELQGPLPTQGDADRRIPRSG